MLRSEAAALVWGDVEFNAADSGLLAVRRYKTDPDAEGSVLYLPWAAMEALEAMRPDRADPAASVFGTLGRQIAKCAGAAATGAGLGSASSRQSGHMGLAALLSRAGTSTHEVAAAGRWQSADTPRRAPRIATYM